MSDKTAKPANLMRPRILREAANFQALCQRASHPRLRQYLAPVLERCSCHVVQINWRQDRLSLVGDGDDCGRAWRPVMDLIVGALLTGNLAYRRALTNFALSIAADSQPLQATIFPGVNEHPGVFGEQHILITGQCGAIPLIFDTFYQDFSESECQSIARYLSENIVDPFLDYLLDRGCQQTLSLGTNIVWWEFYVCLWSLTAVYDKYDLRHRQAFEVIAQLVRRGIHAGVDTSGVVGEGPYYASIEQFSWMCAAEILQRLGVCDLWNEESRLRAMVVARLYYRFPGTRQMLDMGDAYLCSPEAAHGLLLAARRLNMPSLQELWESLTESPPAATFHNPLGALEPLLYFDAEQPRSAASSERARDLAGATYGLTVMRSSWRDDALHVAVHAAGRSPGTFIHQHADAGHFSLAANGEVFTAGREYGRSAARFHNVMLPGGVEPAGSPCPVGQMWRGGHQHCFAAQRGAAFVGVDIGWHWQSLWYYRYAMMVRAPGATPYLIILDTCNQCNDWMHYDWLLQLNQDHKLSIDAEGLAAEVRGRSSSLHMAWSLPQASDFPRAHALSLKEDEVEDAYPNGAVHRRLVARHSGLNASLLTVLMPRCGDERPPICERIHGVHQFGLVVEHGGCQDVIVAAITDRRMDIAGISGEALLAVVRRDSTGTVSYTAAAEVHALKVASIRLAPRGEPITLFESFSEQGA